MFKDAFAHSVDSPMAPAETCFEIVPDDVAELERATKALFVGEGGDVTLVSLNGEAPVTFANLASGSILDVRVRAVKATGTTATGLVGLA